MGKVVHRASLASALYAGCRESPHIEFRFGTYIAEVDFYGCRLRCVTRDIAKETVGQWVEADVIVAADGVKSIVRSQMLMKRGEIDQGAFVYWC
jgi:salicylate hydroxylase